MARVERACARDGRRRTRPAARAAALHSHLLVQPRRVLHGARGRAARGRPHLAQPPPHGGRPAALRSARPRGYPDARAGRAPERDARGAAGRIASRGHRDHARVRGHAVGAGRARSHVPRQHLPRPDPACRRPRAAVPVHLESLALARRDAARPRDGPAAPRAREGARGAAALPARSATTATAS